MEKKTTTSSGTRFLIDLHDCHRGITLDEGFSLEALVRVIQDAGMTVKNASFVPFPDGTVNAHLDLSESHFSMGSYREARYISGELSVCNDQRNNRPRGRKAAKLIATLFEPTKVEITEKTWKTGPLRKTR